MHATSYAFRAARDAARLPGIGSRFLVPLFALALWLVPTGLRAAPNVINVVPITATSITYNSSRAHLMANLAFGSQPDDAVIDVWTAGSKVVVLVNIASHESYGELGLTVREFDMSFTPDVSTAFGSALWDMGTALNNGMTVGEFWSALTEAERTTLSTGIVTAINRVLAPLSSSAAFYSSIEEVGSTGYAALYLEIPPFSSTVEGVPMDVTNARGSLLALVLYAPLGTDVANKLAHIRYLEEQDASMSALQAQMRQLSALIYQAQGVI